MVSTVRLVISTCALVALATSTIEAADGADLRFDRTIPREVLENYLSRSITMMDLCTGKGDVDDQIRIYTDKDDVRRRLQ